MTRFRLVAPSAASPAARAVVAGLLAGLFALTGASAAQATASSPAPAAPPPAHRVALAGPAMADAGASRDVDDFDFASFDAQYTLGRDANGRSTLRTVETLVARFPETDQNHGIRRAIPEDYDGHPTDLHIVSVTDADGAQLDYETDDEDDFEIVTIADDDFVHGEQTYVITYEQSNVTRFYSDSRADEFYWDVNGTAWAQPFERVSATVTVPADLAVRLTGEQACASGSSGGAGDCTIEARVEGDAVVRASATGLQPGETLTIAVGFEEGAFVPRDSSIWASPWSVVLVIALLLLLAVVVLGITARLTVLRDGAGRPTVIPEYLPPAEPELPVLAVIARKPNRAVAATLLSFAVRGFARILQSGSEYRLEYRGDAKPVLAGARTGLGPVELRIARAFFGKEFTPGEQAGLSGGNAKLSTAITKAVAAARAAAVADGYLRKAATLPVVLTWVLGAAATCALFISSVGLLADARGGALPVITLLLAALPVLPVLLVSRHSLTDRGAQARDHLRGMREYLALAEEDRLRMLQSVTGAERRGGAAGESVVRLYERLLPYAVLLGVENSWSEVLATAYEREGGTPTWYSAPDGFSPALFTAGVNSFASSTAASFSGSAASSSSGGSSGGISAGGGGGGGGGGGV